MNPEKWPQNIPISTPYELARLAASLPCYTGDAEAAIKEAVSLLRASADILSEVQSFQDITTSQVAADLQLVGEWKASGQAVPDKDAFPMSVKSFCDSVGIAANNNYRKQHLIDAIEQSGLYSDIKLSRDKLYERIKSDRIQNRVDFVRIARSYKMAHTD